MSKTSNKFTRERTKYTEEENDTHRVFVETVKPLMPRGMISFFAEKYEINRSLLCQFTLGKRKSLIKYPMYVGILSEITDAVRKHKKSQTSFKELLANMNKLKTQSETNEQHEMQPSEHC